jgi:quinol-cytochrome oxidoreductase complex cytochrome b subunit
MMPARKRVSEWIEHRTGLETAVRNFLYEEIPDSSGWHQVFGSVAVFLFLVQGFTGILLAFNYAPTPGDAYNSLQYIVREVTCGRLIRGLHHWGASMMVVLVFVHMAQVFLYGAYKKPREATWMVGVVLLLVTQAFALTGYLLPWDNRAYWGTVVTTQIAAKAPLLGPYLERFLGADGHVGAVTFARFYGFHVMILPALMVFLTGLHIYLVRRHGVTPLAGDTRPPRKFFPEQALKDVTATFVVFGVLFLLAALVDVPLGRLADPTDTGYVPRPEWYYLFLFQMLKVFEGGWEPMGSVVLPGLGIAVLFLVPFLDRRRLVRLSQRVVAIAVLVLVLVGWASLTVAAIRTTPKQPESQTIALPPAEDWGHLSPEELAGLGYFRQEGCAACHNFEAGPPKPGPNLAGVGTRKSVSWMIGHFKNPPRIIPGSSMPPIDLKDAQLNTLAAFLLKLTAANAVALANAPDFAVQGAQVYQASNCAVCHSINDAGSKSGPPLNGVGQRRTSGWVEAHFANPQALSPGSTMPPFRFAPGDMRAIVSYLMSLPERPAPTP